MVKTIVKVEGMMCGMCESHVNDAIRAAFNVKKVNSFICFTPPNTHTKVF